MPEGMTPITPAQLEQMRAAGQARRVEEGRDERSGVRWKRTAEDGVVTTEHGDGRVDVSVTVPTIQVDAAPGPGRPGYRAHGAAPCRCGCGLTLQGHHDQARRQ